MKNGFIKQIDYSLWALLISLFVVIYINFDYAKWNDPKRILIYDVLSYYSYLPAIFVYNDINLDFIEQDKDKLEGMFRHKISPINKRVIITSCGMSMLYFPFFAVAHPAAQILGYKADGYSVPYRFALVMSGIFYLVLGGIFLRRFLLKYFSKLIVGITLLVVILATNLLWYVTVEAPMTHVYSFAFITMFLFIIDRWFENSSIKDTIFIGLLVGIISLIRPTNIVIVILLILWKITSWNELKNRILFFMEKWYLVLIMLFMFLIVWSPQLIYWKLFSGSFLFYSYPESQGFFFQNPQLYNTLFSWRKGFFIYTPVMLFAFIGIGFLYKQKRDFFWPVFIYFLVSWYIISSWWDWWYGGSFGLRPFIDSYGVFSIGLAAFLNWVLKTSQLKKIIFFTLFLLSIALSAWHYQRYYGGSIHWVAMTREAYFDSFWRQYPSKAFYKKIRHPDYKLAREGIYKYEDEAIVKPENK